MVARMITPTISALCSIAFNAPVTANAMVPNKSNISISRGDRCGRISDNGFSLLLSSIKVLKENQIYIIRSYVFGMRMFSVSQCHTLLHSLHSQMSSHVHAFAQLM